MALRFIIGKPGTGKTCLCMEEMMQSQRTGRRNQILIVPEQFTSQAERDLVAHSPQNAILSAQVLSFGRLAHRVFSKTGLGQKIPLGDIGKSMALQRVLLQQKENITFFYNTLNKSGFIDQLGLTISEFYQYHIQPEQLMKQSESSALTQGVREKLADLSTIYHAYAEFMQKDYICADETLALLAQQLAAGFSFADTELWLDGFYGFTPQEYTVIGHLAHLASRITITLPMDRSSYLATYLPTTAPFYEPYMAKNMLCRICSEQHIPVEPPVFLEKNHRAQSKALWVLGENYFHAYSTKCSLADGLQIISCPSRQDEVAFAAGKIQRLVREEGLRYRDIAIVTNALPAYEKSLRAILSEYRIPCFIDSRREITSHPLIAMVTALMEILVYDFRYEHVFSYLKSGLTTFSPEEIDELENYVLAYGIKGYKWRRAKWEYGLQREGEETIAYMNDLRERFMAPFLPLLPFQQKKKLPLLTYITEILNHMNTLGIAETLSLWEEEALQAGNPSVADEHRQIGQLFLEVVQKAADILGDAQMTLAEGTKILSAGLQRCTMGIIPPTADCLVVGDLERSRLAEIKYLFVLGVNEGVLPAPKQPQGIFTEIERQLLTANGMTLAADGKRKAFEEQFLIYCGLTKPSQGIFLTFANSEAMGKALFPSSLIDRLCRMDPSLKVQACPAFSIEETVPTAAFHHIGEKMRTHRPDDPMPPIWQDIYSFFALESHWQKRLALLRQGFVTTPRQERLSPKTAKKLYGSKIFSSVSRLERFASCPFSFFAEYGLKASERRLYQLYRPDLGLLFHEVLELFSNQVAAENIAWDTLTQEKTESMIHTAVDLAAPRMGEQILMDTAANQYLIQRLKRISSRAAWTIVRHLQSGSFIPAGYEVGFGHHEALPPIVIALSEDRQLLLSGKIDRVDVLDANGNRYAKIIDYKSGAKAFSFQDIFYGLQLQLLIYMDAYVKHYEKTDVPVTPGGVFYFRISDPNISLSQEMTAEEIEDALYRKMQMSGLLLAEETVLQGLDRIFADGTQGKSSAIVPVGFTKKGDPSATAHLADLEQYKQLLHFVTDRAAALGDAMCAGVIAPSPYRKGKQQTPCSYCEFRSICRYDYEVEPLWRDLKKIDKKNFWEMLPTDEKLDD